jgi:predicted alpha/beta superfamily hydrolase
MVAGPAVPWNVALKQSRLSFVLLAAACLLGCARTSSVPAPVPNPASPAQAQAAPAATARPVAYSIPDTEVLDIHSALLGRDYQLFVALPESYATQPERRYPVVFVTDANYAFPLVRAIGRRVGDHGHGLEDFILVGLSYAKGDSPAYSRRRDYTPTPRGPASAGADESGRMPVHGGAEAYRGHLQSEVFPLIARTYRVDMRRKVFAGHSYGALLGAHILFTDPAMFSHYILGSPSLWYDRGVMFGREAAYASGHRDLPADVFLGIGAYERANAASGDPRFDDEGDMVGDMLRFRRALGSRRYPGLSLEATVIDGEDHLTVAPVIITRGLRRALPPRE